MSESNNAMQLLVSLIRDEWLGDIVTGSLDLLTNNAVERGSFYLASEDNEAIIVIAVKDDVDIIRKALPEGVLSWDVVFSNQDNNNESASEQE